MPAFPNFVPTADSTDPGYPYNAVIQELPILELESQELAGEVAEFIAAAVREGAAFGLAAGSIYDRKGYLTSSPLSQPNRSYGGTEVALQITVKVPAADAEKIITAVVAEDTDRRRREEDAKRNEIDAQIAALQAQRDAIGG